MIKLLESPRLEFETIATYDEISGGRIYTAGKHKFVPIKIEYDNISDEKLDILTISFEGKTWELTNCEIFEEENSKYLKYTHARVFY